MIPRKRAVAAVPADTLRLLALEALMNYQSLGYVHEGDTLFPAILARLSRGTDAQ